MGRRKIFEQKYELTSENIDFISGKINETMRQYPTLSKKDILRLRLSAEDLLLNWLEKEKKQDVVLLMEENGRNLDLTLSLEGDNYKKNPLENQSGENGTLENLTASLGMCWLYEYDQGVNSVYISIEYKHRNQIRVTGTAMLLAAITVFLLHVIPANLSNHIQEYGIDFLFDYASRFLTALVSPMMFFAVVGGIISVRSPRYLQKNGKKMCQTYLGHILGVNLLALIGCATILPSHIKLKVERGDNTLFSFLAEIIPKDIVSPFIECNMLQIVFMGIVVGVAMLFLQRQVRTLSRVVREINVLICKVINGFESVIMLFLYLSMVNLGMSLTQLGIQKFGRVLVWFVAFLLILIGIEFLRTAKKLGLGVRDLWKELKPTAMVQVCSASSSVAFTEAYEVCENRFRVDKKFVEFALPIGTVMHKPYIAAEFVFMVTALKSVLGQEIDILGLVILFLLTLVLSIAYPPISGGEMICYTILLTQMGLPADTLAIACALSSVLDFLEAPANTLSTLCQLLCTSVDLKKQRKSVKL